MTQRQLESAVAGRTGESVCTIRQRGFHASARRSTLDLEPEDLALVVECPGCGRPLILDRPSRRSQLVDCPCCDAEYPYADDEVVVRSVPCRGSGIKGLRP
jgi:hypothetical protein